MKPYLIGHRGAAGLAPENTLLAFKTGLKNGADIVECDIHLSKDGEIIVIHDNILDRTTNGSGWVRDRSLKDLKKLDAGNGEKIPTLSEVVDLVLKYKKKLIIEIKGKSWTEVKETADKLEMFINKNHLLNKIVVHSFWHQAIKRLKSHLPKVKTGAILAIGLPPKKMINLVLSANANEASVAHSYISKELVSLARTKKISLCAWVLNYQSTFDRMKNMGVRGLITNFPGKFKA